MTLINHPLWLERVLSTMLLLKNRNGWISFFEGTLGTKRKATQNQATSLFGGLDWWFGFERSLVLVEGDW